MLRPLTLLPPAPRARLAPPPPPRYCAAAGTAWLILNLLVDCLQSVFAGGVPCPAANASTAASGRARPAYASSAGGGGAGDGTKGGGPACDPQPAWDLGSAEVGVWSRLPGLELACHPMCYYASYMPREADGKLPRSKLWSHADESRWGWGGWGATTLGSSR